MQQKINNHADDFLHRCTAAQKTLDSFLKQSKEAVITLTANADHKDTQFIRHGFAWQASLVSAFSAITQWIQILQAQQQVHDIELAVANAAAADIVSELLHGIEMSQLETFRPTHIAVNTDALKTLRESFNNDSHAGQTTIGQALNAGRAQTHTGLDDSLTMVADQFRSFSDTYIIPFAQQWHLQNELIPDTLVEKLGELGVFGLTIDEQHGGAGFGKLAMCVVTEELSRGYIGVGSLGTRSEIAAELIQQAGTEAQQQKYLSGIANGKILPTAVFTEPDTGSDLGALASRATRNDDGSWSITGNKTWITHASRSDLMTMLVRTDRNSTDHKGLSMLLIDKQRGTDTDPFPDSSLSGSEIEVLGYRGMREYDLAFDGFTAPQSALLGNCE